MEKFKSKIDLWLLLFLGIVFGAMVIKTAYDGNWGVSIFMLFIIAFIVHMFLTTFYIIENSKLIIKCGSFIDIAIEIEKIKRISETNNVMSSPALSLDRLEIHYDKFDTVMISPKEKTKFIKAIQKINPGIEIKMKSNFNTIKSL
jgi:hypothetical protein